jgi:hypothetical protein
VHLRDEVECGYEQPVMIGIIRVHNHGGVSSPDRNFSFCGRVGCRRWFSQAAALAGFSVILRCLHHTLANIDVFQQTLLPPSASLQLDLLYAQASYFSPVFADLQKLRPTLTSTCCTCNAWLRHRRAC